MSAPTESELAAQPDCRWVVEEMSAYLSDDIPTTARRIFEGHVTFCPPCRGHLAQMRAVLRAAATMEREILSPESTAAIAERFRIWVDSRDRT